MIKVTQFANGRVAQAFIDYMATHNVKLVLERQEQSYALLLKDGAQLALVQAELAKFIKEPDAERYMAASWQKGTTRSNLHYQGIPLWKQIIARAGPLTLSIMVLAVAVYLYNLLSGYSLVIPLSWPDGPAQYFQLWRWFSHALLHFGLMHILFNMLWWWYLGGVVEKRLGSGKLVVLLLIPSLLSGWMQVKYSGAVFGGMDGVVYALMGYSWLWGQRIPSKGIHLESGLLVFVLIWLLLGYYGVFGQPMSTMANLMGLVIGLMMAWTDTHAELKRTS